MIILGDAMKVRLAALTTTVLFLTGVAAGAATPQKDSIEFDVFGQYLTDCDGFDILADFSGDGHAIFFMDKDGNVVRENTHIRYTDARIYNSNDPSLELREGPGEVENYHWDYFGDPPTLALAGTSFKVTVPGYGLVLIRTGRVVADLAPEFKITFIVGQNSFEDDESLNEDVRATLCMLLSP
jgi:hypothetical protein